MKNDKKNTEPLVKVLNLKKYFPVECGLFARTCGFVKAVDGVSFYIRRGETLGLVGESGCGKTTLGRLILRLLEPTGGEIYFSGAKITGLGPERLKKFRRRAQIIFQDPYSSLNPRMTAGFIVGEPLAVHGIVEGRREREEKVGELLERVGLSSRHMSWYPHELSGGMRQRVGIARALSLNPEFIVCDEPVSALDVSIQAQIINLLKDLQDEMNLSYLFISHDLRIVGYMSHRIAVMYQGKIVEIGKKENLLKEPLHPYTKILLEAIPKVDGEEKAKIKLKGEATTSLNQLKGCYFYPRCPIAKELCRKKEPQLVEKEEGHFVACHFH